MKIILTSLAVALGCTASFAQDFRGRIHYKWLVKAASSHNFIASFRDTMMRIDVKDSNRLISSMQIWRNGDSAISLDHRAQQVSPARDEKIDTLLKLVPLDSISSDSVIMGYVCTPWFFVFKFGDNPIASRPNSYLINWYAHELRSNAVFAKAPALLTWLPHAGKPGICLLQESIDHKGKREIHFIATLIDKSVASDSLFRIPNHYERVNTQVEEKVEVDVEAEDVEMESVPPPPPTKKKRKN
ncbi:MAG: hypothetical protein K0Q66_2240 [Chitinophagaceae bacterium]|jgi:hypothetical protein|nr:hypothetical protein [Chitinophagaceae bacterium]